jgi:hypothetical protein
LQESNLYNQRIEFLSVGLPAEKDVFKYSTERSIVCRVYILYTNINNGPNGIRFENNTIKSMIATESKYHSRFQNQQNPVQRLYLKRFAVVIASGSDCTFTTKISLLRNLKVMHDSKRVWTTASLVWMDSRNKQAIDTQYSHKLNIQTTCR